MTHQANDDLPNRSESSQFAEADQQLPAQWSVGGERNVVQSGKYNANIEQGENIHVGDKIQGDKIQYINLINDRETARSAPTNSDQYRDRALDLIRRSYRRHRGISLDCKNSLDIIRNDVSLSQEQAAIINDEILQQSARETQRLENYYQEVEQVIGGKSTLSSDVLDALEGKRATYDVNERAEAQALNDISYRLIQQGTYGLAEACLKRAAALLQGIHADPNPVIYTNLATIRLKQGKLSEALDLLREAKKLYERQRFPDREIETITKSIQGVEKRLAEKNVFRRIFGG